MKIRFGNIFLIGVGGVEVGVVGCLEVVLGFFFVRFREGGNIFLELFFCFFVGFRFLFRFFMLRLGRYLVKVLV